MRSCMSSVLNWRFKDEIDLQNLYVVRVLTIRSIMFVFRARKLHVQKVVALNLRSGCLQAPGQSVMWDRKATINKNLDKN